jgi:hypothetical protein
MYLLVKLADHRNSFLCYYLQEIKHKPSGHNVFVPCSRYKTSFGLARICLLRIKLYFPCQRYNLVIYNVPLSVHGDEYNGYCWWQAYWKLTHQFPSTTSLCPVNFSSLGSNEIRPARRFGGKLQEIWDLRLFRHRSSNSTVYKTRSSTSSLKL